MAQYNYKQSNFSGGLADSELSGIKGSVADAVGISIHELPGVVRASQALIKESGTTPAVVVDFCKWAFNCSNGNSYWFGDTGHIYKRTSGGTWSDVYTDAGGAILGATEFNGYIYWATATKLHEMIKTGNWTTDIDSVSTWPKTLDTASYHPMTVQGLYLFIGNDRKIASVDDVGTFTANGTPDVTFEGLPFTYTIKTIANFGIDILLGTQITVSFASARIFRWDTTSPYWNTDDDIPEDGINAIWPYENYALVQAGTNGSIYYFDGSTLQRIKRIKGDYANKTMTVHPGSVCNFRGVPLFGVSNLSSNPCNQGIYSFGRYSKDYPMALMNEYVSSTGHLTAMEYGALLSIGSTLLSAFKDSTTTAVYGVDAISWSTKYASAYLTTLAIGGNRDKQKTFSNYVLAYRSKPTNTDLTLSYDPNFSGSFTSITLKDQSDYYKMRSQQNVEAGSIQLKVAFTISGNYSPELELVYVDFSEKETL